MRLEPKSNRKYQPLSDEDFANVMKEFTKRGYQTPEPKPGMKVFNKKVIPFTGENLPKILILRNASQRPTNSLMIHPLTPTDHMKFSTVSNKGEPYFYNADAGFPILPGRWPASTTPTRPAPTAATMAAWRASPTARTSTPPAPVISRGCCCVNPRARPPPLARRWCSRLASRSSRPSGSRRRPAGWPASNCPSGSLAATGARRWTSTAARWPGWSSASVMTSASATLSPRRSWPAGAAVPRKSARPWPRPAQRWQSASPATKRITSSAPSARSWVCPASSLRGPSWHGHRHPASEAWTGAGQISACSACVGTHACYTMSTHAQKGVLWNTKKALQGRST